MEYQLIFIAALFSIKYAYGQHYITAVKLSQVVYECSIGIRLSGPPAHVLNFQQPFSAAAASLAVLDIGFRLMNVPSSLITVSLKNVH